MAPGTAHTYRRPRLWNGAHGGRSERGNKPEESVYFAKAIADRRDTRGQHMATERYSSLLLPGTERDRHRGPWRDRGCDAGCSDRREVGERAECQAAARRWASCRPPTLEDSPRFPACSQTSKILKQQQQQQQKMRCFCLPQHVSVLIKRMFCFVFKATNLENNFRDFFLFFVFLFYLNFF